jgi:hypothetical protein
MRPAQEENIREAAFRYLFRHNASGLQQDARVFCLSVHDRDPKDAFLARFHDVKARILPRSACSFEGLDVVHDRERRDEGLLFDVVAEVYWSSDDEAFVDGSYYEAPLSAGGYTWRLRRHGLKWIVESARMLWIS